MKKIILTLSLALAGCTAGDKVAQLSPGMTKAQVIGMMGKPEGYSSNGGDEKLQYLSGPPLWPTGSQISEFRVSLHGGLVTGYEVTKRQAATALVVIPAF
jgi:SmpA/OmlA family protein